MPLNGTAGEQQETENIIESPSDLGAIAQQVKGQGEAIEGIRSSLEQLLSLQTRVAEESEDDELDMHIGEPTPRQLKLINNLVGRESDTSEWLVVPFQASNSLVDFSLRRWHPTSVIDMALTAIGRPILMDHDWYSAKDASVGTIFDCSIVIDSEAPEDVIKGGGYEEYNREIIEDEGYQWLYLCAAIAKNSVAAEGILSRRLSDCSTGSTLSQPYMICPDCSKEHGRDVSFFERTENAKGKKGDFLCPHLIPSKWMLDFISMYGEEGEDYNFAKYCTLGAARNELIENSLVNRGALPAARVIRNKTK